MTLDLVTVVFRDELPLLRLQARSLARFMAAEAVGEVFVLVNDVREAEVAAAVEAMRADYGPLAPHLRVVTASALFAHPDAVRRPKGLAQWRSRLRRHVRRLFRPREGWSGVRGWRVQQALKLAAALVGDAPCLLILDAKNHLLRPVGASDFVAEDGRARASFVPLHPPLSDWVAASCAFVGAPTPDPHARILPTATPFCVPRRVLFDTLKRLEQLGGPVFDLFSDKRRFQGSEFTAIYADVMRRRGALSVDFARDLVPVATIFSKDTPVEIDAAISRAADGAAAFFSIHRSQLDRLRADQRARIEAIWAAAGLEPPEGW